ncbi:hypothetical protein SAMN04490243_2157 [Robiginitalea myxolifaciens]|uniref:Uncharacterized protein n=1 Tax=Robiginitalea myxolifaciens TaxID=400055 RepID=A0A1I6H2X9_9FLAO|nr:hypothetical protein SAMN04490243_2157 [Robiginitalea myxolifaciens]
MRRYPGNDRLQVIKIQGESPICKPMLAQWGIFIGKQRLVCRLSDELTGFFDNFLDHFRIE